MRLLGSVAVAAFCSASPAVAGQCGTSPTALSRFSAAELSPIGGDLPDGQGSTVTTTTFVSPYRSSQHYTYTYPFGTFYSGPIHVIFADGNACGNPNSLQAQQQHAALNIRDVDDEGADRIEGPPVSSIGGVVTRWWGGHSGKRLDLVADHGWRPFEGNRVRAIVTVPVSIVWIDSSPASLFDTGYDPPQEITGAARTKSGTAFQASINGSLEIPATRDWLIAPSASLGLASGGNLPFTFADGTPFPTTDVQIDQELATFALASRYRIIAGRGDLVIANMIAYSTTVKLGIVRQRYYEHSDSIAFSNGLAYQLPLKARLFRRQTSVRASYLWTHLACSGAQYRDYHEFAVNLGIRLREATTKQKAEMLRLGALYAHATSQYTSRANYDSASLTFGYRF